MTRMYTGLNDLAGAGGQGSNQSKAAMQMHVKYNYSNDQNGLPLRWILIPESNRLWYVI